MRARENVRRTFLPHVPPHVARGGAGCLVSLASAAEHIGDEGETIGKNAGWYTAAAWKAGVDANATASLVGAALALGFPAIGFYRPGRAMDTEHTLVSLCEDLFHDTAALLKDGTQLRDAAQAELAAANAVESTDREVIAAAARQAADATACLDILDVIIPRLEYAWQRLSAVPDDIADTYEPVHDLLHRGGGLPYDGAFLTGIVNARTS
jgi:hypothetical protein